MFCLQGKSLATAESVMVAHRIAGCLLLLTALPGKVASCLAVYVADGRDHSERTGGDTRSIAAASKTMRMRTGRDHAFEVSLLAQYH